VYQQSTTGISLKEFPDMSSNGLLTALAVLLALFAPAATAGLSDYLDKLGGAVTGTEAGKSAAMSSLTDQEMVAGLKQALAKGTGFAVQTLGKEGGFLDNARVRIPMPKSLAWVEKSLRAVHQDQLADEFVASMNHAAEQAVPEAAAVFRDAVEAMTVQDARNILSGPDDAATQYFRTRTESALTEKMRPIVARTTATAGVTASYKRMMSSAGSLPGLLSGDATDLDAYVTKKTLDGLFVMVAAEEKQIRTNPVARSTELLKKVFGSVSP
jgi:hypothetical protein